MINGKAALTAMQYCVFSACVATVEYNAGEFADAEITINQILGKEKLSKTDYSHVKTAALGLVDASIKIQVGKKWKGVPLFQYIEGEDGTNMIRFRFNVEMTPFLLKLKEQGNFTAYKYGYLTLLKKNMYAMRVYELLKQHENFGQRKITLEEFREILILSDKYPRFGELNRTVIKPVLDLLKKTDLLVDFSTIKRGRTVTHLLFKIQQRYKTIKE